MPYYIKRKKKEKKLPLFEKAGIKIKKKPDLIKKLDKVLSQYIRLRDSKAFGFKAFICISCGQVKPYEKADCGHYWSRKHMATRFSELNCHAECSHCLTPDALILTSDLRWVPLGEIKEGDEVLSFEEYRSTAQARYWRKGVVTHIHREYQDVYDVELENGDHIKTTANHRWLARKRSRLSYDWVETQELWVNGYNLHGNKKTGPHTNETCSVVCKPFEVVQQDKSYESGWLAGMLDADGHICQQNIHNSDGTIRYGFRIGIAQSETYPILCRKIVELMEKYTNNHKPCRQWMDRKNQGKINGRDVLGKVQTWQFLVTGTNVEKLHFLMRIRPNKMSKVNIDKLGMIRSRYDTKVKSITPIGKQEIVVMETDTHTFIANGYAMHNCNRFKADHLIGFEQNLIRKIGKGNYDLLAATAHTTRKWSDFELEAMIKYYQQKIKEIQQRESV